MVTVPTLTPGAKKALKEAGLGCDDGQSQPARADDYYDLDAANKMLSDGGFEHRKIG